MLCGAQGQRNIEQDELRMHGLLRFCMAASRASVGVAAGKAGSSRYRRTQPPAARISKPSAIPHTRTVRRCQMLNFTCTVQVSWVSTSKGAKASALSSRRPTPTTAYWERSALRALPLHGSCWSPYNTEPTSPPANP